MAVILGIVSAIIEILDKFFQSIKLIIGWDKKWSEKDYLQRYTKGMDLLGSNRGAVGKALIKYYSNSHSTDNAIRYIRYLYPDGETLDLPLVTRRELIRDKGNDLELTYRYGGKVTHFDADKKVIDKSEDSWRAAGLKLWDSPIFSLHDLQLFDSKIEMEFRKTDFFVYRATYGNAFDELALNIADRGLDRTIHALQSQNTKLFPVRTKYMPSLDRILAMSNRICAGGPIVLIAARTDNNDLAFIIQRRSATVSDEPLALTPVPRGFHSAEVDPALEYDLTFSIYREIWEELFGGEERIGGQISPHHFFEKSPAIRDLFERRGTTNNLIPLGLMWDLYRGNFIASYCLYITDVSWWAKYHRNMEVNWEFDAIKKKSAVMANQGGLMTLIHSKEWAVDSYFAFLEGLRWLGSKDEIASKFVAELPKLVLSKIE